MLDGATRVVRNLCAGLGVVIAGGLTLIIGLQIMAYVAARSSGNTLEQEVTSYQEFRDDIISKNKLYEMLYEINGERLVWSDNLRDLFAVLPPGLTVERITIDAVVGEPALSFSGRAVNRNTLIVLEERLSTLAWAQGVTAPHTNLIDRLNPSYVFKLTVKKGESP